MEIEIETPPPKEEVTPKKTFTYDDAIEKMGFGFFQVFVIFCCGFFWVFDGIELSLISYILTSLGAEWSLTPLQLGFIGSMEFLGMMIGNFVGGISGDYFGRKLFFVLGVFIAWVLGMISSFAPDYGSFVVLRLLTGFGIGSTISSDCALLAEYMPLKFRGFALALTNVFQAFGSGFVIIIGYLFLTQFPQNLGGLSNWRYVVLLCAVPGCLISFVRIIVPESPRFYLANNRSEEAYKVLETIAWVNRKELPDGELIAPPIEAKKSNIFSSFPKLFGTPVMALTTSIIWFLFFCMSYGDWGVSYILPKILAIVHNNEQTLVFRDGFFVSLAGLIGYVLCSLVIHKCRRKLMFLFSFFLSATSAYLCCVWYNSYFILGLLSFQKLVSPLAWASIYVYSPEFYPTELRSTGFGMALMCNRIGGIISFSLSTYLLSIAYFWPFLTFGGLYSLAAFCSILLPVETLNKKLVDTVEHAEDQNLDDTKKLLLDETKEKK